MEDVTLLRCSWPYLPGNALYESYHDEVWGVPERDGQKLWTKLMLDIFEGGLGWLNVLKKQQALYSAFADFNPEAVARFTDVDRARLLADKGVIRNQRKIEAVIHNAQSYLDMCARGEDFSQLVWSFVGGRPIQNAWPSWQATPKQTPESERLSEALKARGVVRVGPVTAYAFMQSMGLVNDHAVDCFRYTEIKAMGVASALASEERPR